VHGDWEAQGELEVTPKAFLSFTVVVKKLNELYKSSVSSCHCLNMRLQRFFLDKQKLMDRINSITAEKLIFSYAVQMVTTMNNHRVPGSRVGPEPAPGISGSCWWPQQVALLQLLEPGRGRCLRS